MTVTASTRSINTDYDAILINWIVTDRDGTRTISGMVKKDGKGRFSDGTRIRTSPLKTAQRDIRQGSIVETRNTRYLLMSPATALTHGMIMIFGLFGLKPLDPVMQRQWDAVRTPVGYTNLIDASIVHAASVAEIMTSSSDVAHVLADQALQASVDTMKAAKAILSSDMLDAAITEAEYAMAAPDDDRSKVNPFINEHVMPLVEKLECLARLGEDPAAIARIHLGIGF